MKRKFKRCLFDEKQIILEIGLEMERIVEAN